MKWIGFIAIFLMFFSKNGFGQQVYTMTNADAEKIYDNISVERISGDSLSTSFLIWIKDTVPKHKHLFHSEHVYILNGSGIFYFNNSKKQVSQGDFIFIPKNNWHAVKVLSEEPMKAISIQSPAFDGSDRVFWQE